MVGSQGIICGFWGGCGGWNDIEMWGGDELMVGEDELMRLRDVKMLETEWNNKKVEIWIICVDV